MLFSYYSYFATHLGYILKISTSERYVINHKGICLHVLVDSSSQSMSGQHAILYLSLPPKHFINLDTISFIMDYYMMDFSPFDYILVNMQSINLLFFSYKSFTFLGLTISHPQGNSVHKVNCLTHKSSLLILKVHNKVPYI